MNMNSSRSGCISEKIIWVLIVALYSSFVILAENKLGMIFILAIVCFVLIIDAFQGKGKIFLKVEGYHLWMLVFSSYCSASAIWAIRSDAAIQKGITIFEIMICMFFIYNHYIRINTIQPLVDALRWGGYVIAIYTVFFFGIDFIKYVLTAGSRLENVYANVNSIGIAVALSVVFAFYNIFFVNKKFVISDILLIPSMMVIAATGSRKAIIVVILGVFLLVRKRFSGKNIIRNAISVMVVVFIFIIMLYYLSKLSIFSGISERLIGLLGLISDKGDADSSALLRQEYIHIGLEQFYKSPFLGIGIGSSGEILSRFFGRNTYFHNNFVEMLACGGIVGFCIYYSFYWCFGKTLLKYKKKNLSSVTICLIIIILLLFADYGSISYYSKDRYFILMIIALECRFLKRNSIIDDKII